MKKYLLILLLFACGCGDGSVKVKGTVKFDDGTPLTAGFVKFIGDTTEASGAVQSNGTYTLGALQPGHYKVVVIGAWIRNEAASPAVSPSPTSPPFAAQAPPEPTITYLIDHKFEQPSTSGLTCEVKGAMTYDIAVTKP